MTKSELKNLIKPLVKQCINEVLLEEGILSTVISEVVMGLSMPNVLAEHSISSPPPPRETDTAVRAKLKETKNRMLNAIGKDAYSGVDLFEGTTPLRSGGAPGAAPSPTSPLAGIDPGDSGVDIANLMPGVDKIWKKLM